MPYENVVYKRDELHAQIWARPLRDVAKDYGISDVRLAQVCRKLNVPRPSRGYWAKSAAAQAQKAVPLPPLRPGQPAEYRVTRWRAPPPTEEEVALRALMPPPKPPMQAPFTIAVPEKLTEPHPLIVEARKASAKNKFLRDGLLEHSGPFRVAVSPAQLDRALRILDTLFKAVERAGHSVHPWRSYYDRAHFKVNGERIQFQVKERLVKKSWASPSASGRSAGSGRPPWKLEPSGDLRFKLTAGRGSYDEVTWEDDSRARLEDKINNMFVGILQWVENHKAFQEQVHIRDQYRHAQNEKQRQFERERAEERERVQELIHQAERWDRAALVRRFVAEVEASAGTRGLSSGAGTKLGDWLKWARSTAEKIDAIPELLGR